MDKQDELAAAIRAHIPLEDNQRLPALRNRDWFVIAAAVRSFMGSDEVVSAGREAILENLRDRRLLKWLFAEDPENHGAIGYVDGPIDAETQNECADSLARAALSAAIGEDIGGGRG